MTFRIPSPAEPRCPSPGPSPSTPPAHPCNPGAGRAKPECPLNRRNDRAIAFETEVDRIGYLPSRTILVPEGRHEVSPGRKPWVGRQSIDGAPEGRSEMDRKPLSDSNAIALGGMSQVLERGPVPRILKIRQAAGGVCFLCAAGGAGWQARPGSASGWRSKRANPGGKLKIWS
jgi:hypothetical protein